MKDQLEEVVSTLSEVLREEGEMDRKQLFMQLDGHLSLENYDLLLQIMEKRGLIKREGDTIKWVGNGPA